MSKSKRNGSEAKFYPQTYKSLQETLFKAKQQNDEMGAATILSPNTAARLNAIEPLFRQGGAQVGTKKAVFSNLAREKDEARNDIAMHASHFLQVFNLGAKRKKYSFADRVLFGMHAH